MKFLRCEICGTVVGEVLSSGVPVKCCGREMTVLIPKETDAGAEKHVPAVSVKGDKISVKIGTAEHPRELAHHIEFVYLQTVEGGQRKTLKPDKSPQTEFALAGGDKAVAVFGYCNLHGLWKKSL